ncbi:glycosyltransferase [Aureibacillus halotolerans]|uniref:Glycosyltransferase involved in cell wall biosynthesis n=1 Tax=Aureibacillus halotolerans TaxID=1508390 RepID=A0A4R6TV50_9BACI|nr:glycosyltransferase [Aureibacillus halotolerans]TDQ37648.1 glycosyltransferase involved in cell wall biosynthesis [Aureibacillus halotolerans]
MIRILHYGLTHSLGGIETYLRKIFNEIDKEKFQFDFLIIGNEEPCFYNELKAAGCSFHFITPRSQSYQKNVQEIRSVFENNKYDAFHCHLNTLSYVTPAKIALTYGVNVIVHSRNGESPKKMITKVLHYYHYYSFPFKTVEKVAVSKIAGDWLFRKGGYEVINNGLNVKKYQYSQENRMAIRKELGINNELVLINVGALREQKNHSFLIDTFKGLKEYHREAKLLLVGEGRLRTKLQQQVNHAGLEKDVIFLGNRNDIHILLSAADQFIFPSHYEGFPNAVIEAQSNGLPCIISNTITEEVVINENVYALPIQQQDISSWVKAILDVDINNENRINNGMNVENRGFSVKNEIMKIEQMYGSLV